MTKNRTPTPVYLDPGMHPGLEVKGLRKSQLKKMQIFQIKCLRVALGLTYYMTEQDK